jgi:hypothetical protein
MIAAEHYYIFGHLDLLIMSNVVDNEVARSVGAVGAHNNDDPSTYLYKFSFFDPEYRPQRRKILYILSVPLFFTLVLRWAAGGRQYFLWITASIPNP